MFERENSFTGERERRSHVRLQTFSELFFRDVQERLPDVEDCVPQSDAKLRVGPMLFDSIESIVDVFVTVLWYVESRRLEEITKVR